MTVARAIAYAIVWTALAVFVFRMGVAQLWGSGSDIGLFAAVALAAVAVPGLAWLAVVMLRDIDRRFHPQARLPDHRPDSRPDPHKDRP